MSPNVIFRFFLCAVIVVVAASDVSPLSIDERILLANQNGGMSSATDSDVVVDADMIMSRTRLEEAAFAGGVVKGDRYRWPRAIVPYKYSSEFKSSHKLVIRGAMREWSDRTCVRFIQAGDVAERLAGHYHSVKFIDGDGCWARVGYEYGSSCSLQIRGCIHHEVVLHELGHVIGLFHEQSRIDRDDHVKIITDNIQSGKHSQFAIDSDTETLGMPYDYCSIMHYGVNYFAKRSFTILPRDLDYTWTIGRVKKLSFTDAKVVNLMYNCNEKCEKQPDCKEPCYVNHKCQCECEESPCEKHPCLERTSEYNCKLAQRYLKTD